MSEEQLRAELSKLQTQLAAMRQQVTDLTSALEHVRTQKTSSMRQRRRCPQCNCHRLVEVTAVSDAGGEGPMTLVRTGTFLVKKMGQCTAYVCTECGLIEWYAQSPEAIEPNDTTVILHENKTSTKGSYR